MLKGWSLLATKLGRGYLLTKGQSMMQTFYKILHSKDIGVRKAVGEACALVIEALWAADRMDVSADVSHDDDIDDDI